MLRVFLFFTGTGCAFSDLIRLKSDFNMDSYLITIKYSIAVHLTNWKICTQNILISFRYLSQEDYSESSCTQIFRCCFPDESATEANTSENNNFDIDSLTVRTEMLVHRLLSPYASPLFD